jgi:hypothetical protein
MILGKVGIAAAVRASKVAWTERVVGWHVEHAAIRCNHLACWITAVHIVVSVLGVC